MSVHVSRFPVTEIDLSHYSVRQFGPKILLGAIQLLIHVKVDIVGRSGTSSGSLGCCTDEELVQLIKLVFRMPATTSFMALNRDLGAFAAQNLRLITPDTTYMPS